jgi:hypothetical protein
MNEDQMAVLGFFVSVIVIGFPFAVALALRMVRRGQPPASPATAELNERLERMEHAIDSIGIEVERISEGQRFTTKLLSERETEPARALPPRREPGA